jgi:hypothetical protein
MKLFIALGGSLLTIQVIHETVNTFGTIYKFDLLSYNEVIFKPFFAVLPTTFLTILSDLTKNSAAGKKIRPQITFTQKRSILLNFFTRFMVQNFVVEIFIPLYVGYSAHLLYSICMKFFVAMREEHGKHFWLTSPLTIGATLSSSSVLRTQGIHCPFKKYLYIHIKLLLQNE